MATGEEITAEALGGADVHTRISGGADYFCKTQEEGILKVREILSMEPPQNIHCHRFDKRPPRVPADEIYEILPAQVSRGIDVRAFIRAISDDSEFVEYKRRFAPGRGENIVTGKIKIDGIPVGVIASNGVGIIFVEAAKKGNRMDC